ncbi:MAG: RNA pseudouridine synthase [SAR324 cluster bacterium]|uniref:Pseudouridine synthase n=1 Tax=SAR324 cluster bacterium TaxID=2024889 RepID=A0A2A4TCB7_9DELT|nr:MAG: RNA pseudouridine synthase [SAR324 cluster bacterium]
MDSFIVGKFIGRKRLDIVLAEHENISSRSRAQKMIQSGLVSLEGYSRKLAPKTVVRSGDVITFEALPVESTELVAVPYDLDIVFEDDHLIIVNKPKGMVVHPAVGHAQDTLVNYLLYHTRLSEVDAGRPGIVHRIDKDTSGLLVVAKDVETHEGLALQFFEHRVARKYEALVWGRPEPGKGIINQPLGRHPVDRKKFAIKEGGKRAVTHWEVRRKFRYLSLIECRLETGRTHQIRVHMNSIGHSLLGDPFYGRFRNYAGKYPIELLRSLKKFEGQALHAKTLGFEHPRTGQWVEFDSELPEEMQRILNALDAADN